MKNYVTFGQKHTHSINGKTLDKNCVAVYESKNEEEGRDLAFKMFDGWFHNHYTDETFKEEIMEYYPRGLIYI